MRLLLLVPALAVLLAAGGIAPPDPLADLHAATYVTARDLALDFSYGEAALSSGVVALFDRGEARTAGIAVGGMELTLDKLPQGGGVLDLFHEIQPSESALHLTLQAAYMCSAPRSGASLASSAVPLAIRPWEQLSADEQQHFTDLYLQAYGDTWTEQPAGPGGGHPGAPGAALRLRDPVGKELFAALWTAPTADDPDGRRYDIRRSEDGSELTIDDYARGLTMYQTPWAPEQGQPDSAVQFQHVTYLYWFTPPSGEGASRKLGRLEAVITTQFSVSEARTEVSFLSYPWLDFTSVTEPGGAALTATRGGPGLSPWVLTVKGDFKPGQDYALAFEGGGFAPDSFDAIGYGGAYRFGTGALYPGEDNPVDIAISLHALPGELHYLASGGAVINTDAGVHSASWQASTRSCMLIATPFDPVDVTTAWGTLHVYAPPDLSGSVPQMDSVTSVGDMLSYYSGLWGPASPAMAGAQPSQDIFLLPEESGVQAFEDSGLVFILGGQSSYGSGAMGLPLVAHEVAHIWWGQGFSGPRWFTEGMANYAAAKFIEDYKTSHAQPDAVSYRRYLINFALASALPLSIERRDDLDDRAAIYHNSAAFLLTCDQRLPGGLDPALKQMYAAGLNASAVSHEELRGMFGDASSALPALWDKYVERGEVDKSDTEDDTFREFVMTHSRESYVRLLGWLTPARRKQAQGDFAGALYCANRALVYRDEPKDRLLIAELTYRANGAAAALPLAEAVLSNANLDAPTRVKTYALLASLYKETGDSAKEKAALKVVVDEGPAVGALNDVQNAKQRLAELGG